MSQTVVMSTQLSAKTNNNYLDCCEIVVSGWGQNHKIRFQDKNITYQSQLPELIKKSLLRQSAHI